MNIIPLNRLDMYEFFCDTDIIDEVLNEIKNTELEWTPDEGGRTAVGYLESATCTPYYNHRLFNWYQECLDKISSLHFDDRKLTITDSWVNSSAFGGTLDPHIHMNSVISGLLYFSDFKKSSTVFSYEDQWRQHLPNINKTYNKNTTKIIPQKGKLVVWRSDIMHHMEPHTDIKNTRYTMTFNTFFDNEISNKISQFLSIKVNSAKDRYEAYMNKNNETM